MKQANFKKGAISLLALTVLVAGMPVSAATTINNFRLLKDTVAMDGSINTGEFYGVQYDVSDPLGLRSAQIEVATADNVGDITGTALINLEQYFNEAPAIAGVYPPSYTNSAASTIKIDPDWNNGTTSVVRRLTLVTKNSKMEQKRSAPIWVTIFGNLKITNFDVDGKTQSGGSGLDISPVILKQDKNLTTGNILKVMSTVNAATKRTLTAGSKKFPITLDAQDIDADAMQTGKYNVQLSAIATAGLKDKTVVSKPISVTVLGMPELKDLRYNDTTVATSVAGAVTVKNGKCKLSATKRNTDDVEFLWTGINLTKLALNVDGVDYLFPSPSRRNATVYFQPDCLATTVAGTTYPFTLKAENTKDYQVATVNGSLLVKP
ncbi:MAG: hypothetical protein WCG01_02630 [bacterium]